LTAPETASNEPGPGSSKRRWDQRQAHLARKLGQGPREHHQKPQPMYLGSPFQPRPESLVMPVWAIKACCALRGLSLFWLCLFFLIHSFALFSTLSLMP